MAQLVEQRIRNAWVTGSSPVIGSFAVIAQLAEHWLPKPKVTGSSPAYRSSTATFKLKDHISEVWSFIIIYYNVILFCESYRTGLTNYSNLNLSWISHLVLNLCSYLS